ncbi:MAG: hypothetical protein PHS93_09150 [Candidatus Omnitrophica bacterium]|nr:hypothetical protein [Candidatus Omnitrophota bacterium]
MGKEHIAWVIIIRIFGFPFFISLSLIGALTLWVKWCINFIHYGGEAVAYNEKMRRKTITDLFYLIQEEKVAK